MIKHLLALSFVACLWLFAPVSTARADAFNGYVCRVSVTGTGAYSFTIYTGPSCSGTSLGTFNIRTSGWDGTEANYNNMLSVIADAAGSQVHITGTFTLYNLFGSPWRLIDTIQFSPI